MKICIGKSFVYKRVESDSLILMGPFQFRMFYNSMNCQRKKNGRAVGGDPKRIDVRVASPAHVTAAFSTKQNCSTAWKRRRSGC